MRLSEEEIIEKLKHLERWDYIDNSLLLEYTSKNFTDSLAIILKIGIEAEKMDHHPDILIHSWNKLKISLSTHSEKGITTKDFELATIINNLL